MDATIGQKTKSKIMNQVQRLLNENIGKVNDAYIENDDELDITLKVQLRPAGRNGLFVQTTISFIESRVKMHIKEPVDESQLAMFPQEAAQ